MLDIADSGHRTIVQSPTAFSPQRLVAWKPTTINFPEQSTARSTAMSMASIALSVAMRHGLPLERFRGRERCRRVSWARQEAMYQMYVTGRFSFKQVATALRRKDHTTVIAGLRAYCARHEIPYPKRNSGPWVRKP